MQTSLLDIFGASFTFSRATGSDWPTRNVVGAVPSCKLLVWNLDELVSRGATVQEQYLLTNLIMSKFGEEIYPCPIIDAAEHDAVEMTDCQCFVLMRKKKDRDAKLTLKCRQQRMSRTRNSRHLHTVLSLVDTTA